MAPLLPGRIVPEEVASGVRRAESRPFAALGLSSGVSAGYPKKADRRAGRAIADSGETARQGMSWERRLPSLRRFLRTWRKTSPPGLEWPPPLQVARGNGCRTWRRCRVLLRLLREARADLPREG